jgi:hypothetical protein
LPLLWVLAVPITVAHLALVHFALQQAVDRTAKLLALVLVGILTTQAVMEVATLEQAAAVVQISLAMEVMVLLMEVGVAEQAAAVAAGLLKWADVEVLVLVALAVKALVI